MTLERDGFFEALLEDDAEELYENAPCAYVSSLPDGTIIKANRTFFNWTGFDHDEVVARRRLQDLLAPGDRIFFETHFAPALRMQGQVREIAVEVVCDGGDRLPVLVNAVLEEASDGTPRVIRSVLFDARERRSYETELLAARQRAEDSEARARALATTLQESFLPPSAIDIPGLDVGAVYRPAGAGDEVGGDFYDVFETGRGNWAVVLGDVCGKGAGAAVVTALARYIIRAEAVRTPYPSAVLAALHEALVRHYPDQCCTALYLAIDPTRGGAHVTVASGGHHLPLVRRATGAMEYVGEPGTILGMLDLPRIIDARVVLHPGDTIVLYTDGVVEARNAAGFFDDEGLEAVVGGSRDEPAQDLAEAIARAAIDFQPTAPRDDIAVVVIRVP